MTDHERWKKYFAGLESVPIDRAQLESIYQAFKTRLIEEVVAREHLTHDSAIDTPLVDIGEQAE